jgi:hypothetical protein
MNVSTGVSVLVPSVLFVAEVASSRFPTEQKPCQPEILYVTLFHFISHFFLHSLITYAIMRGVRYGHSASGTAFG